MRLAQRHRAVLTAALATALSVVPVHAATADGAPVAPSLSVHVGAAVDVFGTPTDLIVSVANPPTDDAFVRLLFSSGPTDLHLTDAAGHESALNPQAEGLATVDVGDADANDNHIPGTQLAPGDIHLRVYSGYSAADRSNVYAQLIDGATGRILSTTRGQDIGTLVIHHPVLTSCWGSPTAPCAFTNPMQVSAGDSAPVQYDVNASMLMSHPPASTVSSLVFTAQQLTAAGYTAHQVAAALHPQFGDATTSAPTWTISDDGSLSLRFPPQLWTATSSDQRNSVRFTAGWSLPAGALAGTVEMTDADGRLYARSDVNFAFTRGPIPASLRWNLFAVDGAGTLWNYGGTGDELDPFQSRRSISKGWGAYTIITSLDGQRADGAGDVVGRDAGGTLWLHRGTGNPAGPLSPARVAIGKGWNAYTAIAGVGDVTGDGHPDLVGRDTQGVLWIHRSTGNPTSPIDPARIRVTTGWNAYNIITGVGDITGDGHPDLLGRDANGVLWIHRSTGNPAGPFDPARVRVSGNWNTYTSFAGIRDLTADGHPDLITRDNNGVLWLHQGTGNPTTPFTAPRESGTGWNTNTIVH